MKRLAIILVTLALLIGGGYTLARLILNRADHKTSTQSKDTPANDSNSQNQSQSFDKSKHSIDQAGSVWWVVNKKRPLPEGYAPSDLMVPNIRLRLARSHEQMQVSRHIAADLEAMFAAAEKVGIALVLSSAYRSHALQKQFYDSYVAKDGQAAADRYSARPGTSEHQTGLAVDIIPPSNQCHLEICFADLPEGQWLKDHAHEYGFIVRYPDGKEGITGYQYEPWHLRYVGPELAGEMKRTGVTTLEEFFGLPAAPSY